jgi:hypothetical protein
MESIDPANMADVNKNFSKPGEYGAVLQRLAERNVYAITSSFLVWTTTRRASRIVPSMKSIPGLQDFRFLVN